MIYLRKMKRERLGNNFHSPSSSTAEAFSMLAEEIKVVSPKTIEEQADTILPGQVMILDKTLLSPKDIAYLVEPTRRRQFEISLDYDGFSHRFYYSIGNEHQATITPSQTLVASHIRFTVKFNLHTHPIYSSLAASPGDVDEYLWNDPSCRFFIGKYGINEDDRYDGLLFQEFNRHGENINGRTNAETVSKIIAERINPAPNPFVRI